MSKHTPLKPLSAAVGVAFIASLAGGQALAAGSAAGNPFAMTELSGGYRVADAGSKAAEGNCGANKQAKSTHETEMGKPARKTAEGNCGASKADKSGGEMKDATASSAKTAEGEGGGTK